MKLFVPALLFLTLAAGAVSADSLYPIANAPASLFADNKARRVGDSLTIVITENAAASTVATTVSSKTEGASYGPGIGSVLRLIRSFGLSGSLNSNASGNTGRTSTLTATVSVTVKEVLPNGNLVVEGTRHVGRNSETEEVTLSGIVRPLDIAPDNTVQSPLVADAQIKYTGKGTVGDKQHDGLVTKIFKVLF